MLIFATAATIATATMTNAREPHAANSSATQTAASVASAAFAATAAIAADTNNITKPKADFKQKQKAATKRRNATHKQQRAASPSNSSSDTVIVKLNSANCSVENSNHEPNLEPKSQVSLIVSKQVSSNDEPTTTTNAQINTAKRTKLAKLLKSLYPFPTKHQARKCPQNHTNCELPTVSLPRASLMKRARRYLAGGGGDVDGKQTLASKSLPGTPLKATDISQQLTGRRASEPPETETECGEQSSSTQPDLADKNQRNKSAQQTRHRRLQAKPSVRFEEQTNIVEAVDTAAAAAASNKQYDKDQNVVQKVESRSAQTTNEASTRVAQINTDQHKLTDKLDRCYDCEQPSKPPVDDDGFADVRRLFGEPPLGSEPGESPMSSGKFRAYGYRLIDYISNYLDTIDKRRVTPLNIEPGYLKTLIQADAPEKGESFAKIMHDFESHIMCGITHWQHPRFHAYFPAGNAYPSILADMLSDAIGCVGFSWAASPACTELEIIMLDWMGKMIGLPAEFLCLSGTKAPEDIADGQQQQQHKSGDNTTKASKGGGVIQGSASECVLVALLAARHWAMEKLREKYENSVADGVILSKLTGYCSKEAHSCVEKAAMIGFIRMRALETDDQNSLRGQTLRDAIVADIAQGFEPFLVSATLGTTSCCSFDNLDELGIVCAEFDIWLHVDGAYAGSALICPEFKHLMRGIERATSFNMNPNKWMLINFDCSLMWVKDRFKLTRAFVVDPLYLQHSYSDQAIDYRHWGIPLSRRFRALKLWFVIRNYGIAGLQAYIRNHVRLAKLFETLVRQDPRFVITNQVVLGLVCFRLIGSNALNQRLLSMINASGKLHMVPAALNGRYIVRFCVCAQNASEADIRFAYQCISDFATDLFDSIRAGRERVRAISQQNTIDISCLALHTQQSLSADRLQQAAEAAAAATSSSNSSTTTQNKCHRRAASPHSDAARQHYALTRNGRHNTTLADCGSLSKTNEWALPEPVAAACGTTGSRNASRAVDVAATIAATDPNVPIVDNATPAQQQLPISSLARGKSPLCKQNSTMANNNNVNGAVDVASNKNETTSNNIITTGVATTTENSANEDDDEDLEREISLASNNGGGGVANNIVDDDYDDLIASTYFDDDDDELIDDDELDNLCGPDATESSAAVGVSPMSAEATSQHSNNKSLLTSSSSPNAGTGGELEEANDEVYSLKRRNKMSLRYKRKFFVHTTSDPRVYRVSISGDINAHKNSSCASLGAAQQQSPQQQPQIVQKDPQKQQQQ